MATRYGDAIERDYSEIQSLRKQLAQAQSLAAEVQAQLKDREKTILHLQRHIRTKVFTHLTDLTPTDLTVPDDMFPEADASGLYNLTREQVVHLLLKKEMVIRGLVRRVWATKLERDQWMLRAHRAQQARGKPTTGPPVRGYHSEIQQWVFADRTRQGVERVEERMQGAIRRDRPVVGTAAPEYNMKERVDTWTRDPIELGPLVDLGGNGYYGRRPEWGSGVTDKEMMDDEDNSVLWNVSDNDDGATARGTKGGNHTKTPDPTTVGQSNGTHPEALEWSEKRYLYTSLASNFVTPGTDHSTIRSSKSSGALRLDLRGGRAGDRKEEHNEVDPSFWLPEEPDVNAPSPEHASAPLQRHDCTRRQAQEVASSRNDMQVQPQICLRRRRKEMGV